ncbi:hypothetical protein SAMN04515691_3289 [Leifsonia sp. 98AMF]|uniref:hypothetical protein n=1 Tax=unclassified Leifsonia TaxID=2663824 RepID=UPI00087BE31E|nr:MULTISPECIES: hypothetical protein [unclassified Leifsonia]SDH10360.1 hypothetical protein SAMN04515690_0728 [Leifsonia sp. 197AMF]SDJ28756.1 hypothetical protein SAMN04515684_3055 [Leifsonia sp. 466MF]SDK52027.1 hypothetical protein SAMN04515683_3710 [Leifsonia sp. 157MF]SDN50616.1 hypothetical protein SAMN04515686_1240 [Leifsonia sp. 509MF]SEN59700.1 hypothetical protein SAMN04515685_3692 [Leifsonia sp. 467MF]
MELTVIRNRDRRRMVVAVEAETEGDALRAISKAIGPVTVAHDKLPVRRSRAELGRRHARVITYF